MPISGIFNAFAQLANNDFNSYEASKNRRWQEAMYEKQFSDSKEMWKMQQEYNTPANQVARLKQAGINPYLALGNINTGSATSAPSSQAGSGAQATGVPANFAGMTQGVLSLLRNKDERQVLKEQAGNIAADSLSKRIDAMTQHQKNLSEIISKLSGADKDAAQAALSRSLRSTEDELRGYKVQAYVNEATESLFRQFSQMQFLQYYPVAQRAEIAETLSRTALNEFNSQSDLSKIIHDAEKLIGRKMTKEEKHDLFEAMKKSVIVEPTKNMSPSGAAATIGSVLGSKIKYYWNKLWD